MAKGKSVESEADLLEKIKKLVVIAMFSDNALEETLVLKGGNALDLVHKLSARASVDVDFSMEADLPEALPEFRSRVEAALQSTMRPEGYEVFDVRIAPKPAEVTADLASFWGGYGVEFKIITKQLHDEHQTDIDSLRRFALRIGQGQKFLIDISRFEFIEGKEALLLDGFRIFVYSAEMIVCEKLRAICQQMPKYGEVVKRGRAGIPRARDFIDIYTLVQAKKIDLARPENRKLLKHIFEAKKAPIELLSEIHNFREFHRANFPAVVATVKTGTKVESFDFYYDFVLGLIDKVKAP